MHNKKAQIGETTTWVVATIIILVILGIFIGLSSQLAKIKSLELKKIFFKIKPSGFEDLKTINNKNSLAYSLNSNNKNKIEEWLNEAKNKDE